MHLHTTYIHTLWDVHQNVHRPPCVDRDAHGVQQDWSAVQTSEEPQCTPATDTRLIVATKRHHHHNNKMHAQNTLQKSGVVTEEAEECEAERGKWKTSAKTEKDEEEVVEIEEEEEEEVQEVDVEIEEEEREEEEEEK